MTIAYDSFDRANAGSLGTSEAAWSETSGAWTISSNKALGGSTDGEALLTMASAEHQIHGAMTAEAGTYSGLVARMTGNKATGTYYELQWWGPFAPLFRLRKIVSGSATNLGETYPSTPSSSDLLLRVSGSSTTQIQCWLAGALQIDYSDSSSPITSGVLCGITQSGTGGATFDSVHARDLAAQSAFPSTGLKGQWRLNESAGANDAIDDSGNSHNLTQTSSPGSTTGIESTARTFDGANDYFSVADHADLSPTTKMTFAAWTYRSSGTGLCIASKWNYDVGADGWALQEDRVYVGTSTEFTYTRPSTGAWHHFALVVDTTQSTDALKVAVYIDGVLQVKGGTPTVALNDNADAFALGTFPGLGRHWNGNIDLAQFWSEAALTQDQVLDLYNAGAGLAYSSGGGGSAIKTINGLALASVKTFNGLAIASVKTINGLA